MGSSRSKSQVCCVHHYRKTAPNKSGQLSVVYIRWTFMGLEGAVNGVDRTRTFSILVQSVSMAMASFVAIFPQHIASPF